MGKPIAFYDPDCGFCTSFAQWLARRNPDCEVRPMTPRLLAEFGIDPERATCEVPFLHPDGRVSWGAAAIAAGLQQCPAGWWALGSLIGSAPGQLVARPVYRWVAANRHRLPGGTPACDLSNAPRRA